MRLFRIVVLLGRFKKNIDKFIKTNNFHYVLWITIITVILGALGISFSENKSFTDGLWWSFVTVTTVGYGDISPITSTGRIIASILMLVGIGFIGMLTGTISTFFINKKSKKYTYKDEIIENIKSKLDEYENLSENDINDICSVLKSLKH
jgi:voltage-gated potassium channel